MADNRDEEAGKDNKLPEPHHPGREGRDDAPPEAPPPEPEEGINPFDELFRAVVTRLKQESGHHLTGFDSPEEKIRYEINVTDPISNWAHSRYPTSEHFEAFVLEVAETLAADPDRKLTASAVTETMMQGLVSMFGYQ